MKFLVRFEGYFNTPEEAYAVVNAIEKIKDRCAVETREKPKAGMEIQRSCQVWKSFHDEVNPEPCKLLTYVDFNSGKVVHEIDGTTPTIDLL